MAHLVLNEFHCHSEHYNDLQVRIEQPKKKDQMKLYQEQVGVSALEALRLDNS